MELLQRASDRLMEATKELYQVKLCSLYSLVENDMLQSPIEQILYTELLVAQMKGCGPQEIMCQYEVDKYRVDISKVCSSWYISINAPVI